MIHIRKKTLHYAPMVLMLFGLALNQFARPFGMMNLVSLATWIIVFACMWMLVQNTIGKRLVWPTMALMYCLLAAILLSVVSCGQLSYQMIVVVGCFLELPIVLCGHTRSVSYNTKKAIYILNVVLSVYYIILSLSPLAYLYTNEWGTKAISALTLSYNNPNETAMHLFSCAIVLAVFAAEMKNKWLKRLVLLDAAVLSYLIYRTESRLVMVLTGVFALLCIYYRFRRPTRLLRMTAFFIPLLTVPILMAFNTFLTQYSFMGDALDTGRAQLYRSVFEGLTVRSFFLGNFSNVFQNLHNGFVSVFGTIGLLGTVAFYALLYIKLKELQKKEHQPPTKIAFLGLLCVVLQTSMEAAYITGGSPFAASVASIYLLCLSTDAEAG